MQNAPSVYSNYLDVNSECTWYWNSRTVLSEHLGLKTTNSATSEIATNWLPSVSVVNAINTATSDYRIAEGAHIMSTTDEEMTKAENDQKKLTDDIKALRARYEPLISSDLERQSYGRFSQEWERYEAIHERVISLSRAIKTQKRPSCSRGRQGARLIAHLRYWLS